MKVITMLAVTAMLLAHSSATYAQGAQANSSVAGSTSAQADKSGAQASSLTSASASAQAGQNSARISNGMALNATLSQPVDAKKNKPGDPIAARTTQSVKSNGKVVIPKGSRLVGHVTEAKARGKGESESAVGIVFDKAILKSGQEVPLNVTLQAVAAAQAATTGSLGGDDLATSGGAAASGRATGGGALGGVRSTAGSATGAVANTAANVGGVAGGATSGAVNSTVNETGAARGSIGGLNTAGQLTSNSQGVFGLNGLNLSSAASNSTQGSLITSTSRNVHLDSGTQLLLVAHDQASAGAPK